MKSYIDHTITLMDDGRSTSKPLKLIAEEPLSIRLQGKPYSVVMRTPGEEIAHVAGFCLAEGIADTPEDITTLGFCDGEDTNVVTVTLTSERQQKISKHLDRRGFISQTSCGICGKEVVRDLVQTIAPLTDQTCLNGNQAYACLTNLSAHQPLRAKTRAVHAAAIYDANYKLLAAAEDVGRHNALDKVVGRLFLDGKLNDAILLTLSSRISYELVQKAARAKIPVVLAMSRPTALAVELGNQLNMTLGCLGKSTGINLFCGAKRLTSM